MFYSFLGGKALSDDVRAGAWAYFSYVKVYDSLYCYHCVQKRMFNDARPLAHTHARTHARTHTHTHEAPLLASSQAVHIFAVCLQTPLVQIIEPSLALCAQFFLLFKTMHVRGTTSRARTCQIVLPPCQARGRITAVIAPKSQFFLLDIRNLLIE